MIMKPNKHYLSYKPGPDDEDEEEDDSEEE